MSLNIQALTLMLLTILFASFSFELSVAIPWNPHDPIVTDVAMFACDEGRPKLHFKEVRHVDYSDGKYTLLIDVTENGSQDHETFMAVVKLHTGNRRQLLAFGSLFGLEEGGRELQDKSPTDPDVIDVAKWSLAEGTKILLHKIVKVDLERGTAEGDRYLITIRAKDFKGGMHLYNTQVNVKDHIKRLASFQREY